MEKNSIQYSKFSPVEFNFLNEHIELTKYQKQKIFGDGRRIGRTTSMYMTIMLQSIECLPKTLHITQQLIQEYDRPTHMGQFTNEFNYFSDKYFHRLFTAIQNNGRSVDIEVDVKKLKEKYPELLV